MYHEDTTRTLRSHEKRIMRVARQTADLRGRVRDLEAAERRRERTRPSRAFGPLIPVRNPFVLKIRHLQRTIDRLERRLKARGNYIETLRTRKSELTQHLRQAADDRTALHTRIGVLGEQVAVAHAELHRKNVELDRKDRQLTTTRAYIRELENRLACYEV